MPHHPNLPEHRSMAEAVSAIGVFTEAVKSDDVRLTLADALQAGAVIADHGSQYLHMIEDTHPPVGGKAKAAHAEKAMTKEECLKKLEEYKKACEAKAAEPVHAKSGPVAAEAFPWAAMLPMVLQIITDLIKKRRQAVAALLAALIFASTSFAGKPPQAPPLQAPKCDVHVVTQARPAQAPTALPELAEAADTLDYDAGHRRALKENRVMVIHVGEPCGPVLARMRDCVHVLRSDYPGVLKDPAKMAVVVAYPEGENIYVWKKIAGTHAETLKAVMEAVVECRSRPRQAPAVEHHHSAAPAPVSDFYAPSWRSAPNFFRGATARASSRSFQSCST